METPQNNNIKKKKKDNKRIQIIAKSKKETRK